MKLLNIIRNPAWWWRRTTKLRSDFVYIPSLKTKLLDPEWYDRDRVMLHACFTILGQFVEHELGRSDDKHSYRGYRLWSSDEKAIDLWLWWKEEYPKIQEEWCNSDFNEWMKKYNNGKSRSKWKIWDPEDIADQKLRELINIRRTLWT